MRERYVQSICKNALFEKKYVKCLKISNNLRFSVATELNDFKDKHISKIHEHKRHKITTFKLEMKQVI